MPSYFPFELHDYEGEYSISVPIDGEEIFMNYIPFFESHGYSGNGVTWEGMIIHVLENIEPELIDRIDFNSEGDAFYAVADSKETQLRFAGLLSPIFSDLKKLEVFVKSADRSQIDD